jgi:predicted O-methyltransferase YrrM
MIKKSLRSFARGLLGLDELLHLRGNVIEVNDLQELKKVFGWRIDPILDDPATDDFRYIEDLNQRRIRDAESLAATIRNTDPKVCLDIGTGLGHSAARMAVNAPPAKIYTVNIPPEEFEDGGVYTTVKLEKEQIGSYYRERGFENVTQIFANTAYWEPDIGQIDVAYIDGSHDTRFVINDTLKVLKYTKPGSFILWHDFNLSLVDVYPWIRSVCLGVETLYKKGLLTGRIFHLRDSWVGIYHVQ